MPVFREGKVTSVRRELAELIEIEVELPDGTVDAVAYPKLIGSVRAGDRVVLNVTSLILALGTGGVAFVVWNLDGEGPGEDVAGHIMKMRYTPLQTEVMAAEAPESPHHELLSDVTDIAGTPVIACGLHSQLAGVVAGVKAADPALRVGYLMTDGGALPLALSDLVRDLTTAGLLDVTCTSGNAFGGELESVNEFSGLIALRHAGNAEVVVAGMGPGVVGTSTAVGFTAMEQGQLLDAAGALEGRPVAVLRLSFDDERERHVGLSHHSVGALTIAARQRALVAVPKLSPQLSHSIARQLDDTGVCARHDVIVADGRPGLELLKERGLDPSTMGRPMSESPEPFLAAAAAGAAAAGLLRD